MATRRLPMSIIRQSARFRNKLAQAQVPAALTGHQNFCGFESITHAHRYLAVFEKLYRFTPFSQEAQPRIRGQSP